jgi:Na+-driven multidrug efflux pump
MKVEYIWNMVQVVGISMASKVLNLASTIFLARKLSKEAIGMSKLTFDLAFNLILYFPRETLRKTAQKYCTDNDHLEEGRKLTQTAQLSWMLTGIFNILSIFLFMFFSFFTSQEEGNLSSNSDMKSQLLIYIITANLELCVEPIILYLNLKMEMKKKLFVVTMGNYTRIFSNIAFAYLFEMDVWSITMARVASTTIYITLVLYYGFVHFKLSKDILFPNFRIIQSILLEEKESKSGRQMKEVYYSFIKATLLKMILTYSKQFILNFMIKLSISDKAEYAFVTDTFAIIVRYFLEPIEENFFNMINKEKSTALANNTESSTMKLLEMFIRFMMIFGGLLMGYIFVIGRETIVLVYTEKWGSESTNTILKFYSIYTAIISINGITEAYSNATFSNRKMQIYNYFMVLNSVILLLSCVVFSQLIGLNGLIVGNGVAMLLRIFLNMFLQFSEINETKDIQVESDFDQILFNKTKRELRQVINKMYFFYKKCLMKSSTMISTFICIYSIYLIKQRDIFIQSNFKLVFVSGIIFCVNAALVVVLEKKQFIDIIRRSNTEKRE